jgi:hypothetical protein
LRRRNRTKPAASVGDYCAAVLIILFMEYQAFAESRCEGYFELETAAKNGDGKSQQLLSDLYRRGYCGAMAESW